MAKRAAASPMTIDAPALTAPRRGRISNAEKARRAAEIERAAAHVLDEEEIVRAAPALARNRPRPAREAPRELVREPERRGATVVVGRNGEELSRRRVVQGDVYFVAANEIPRGWDYQWNPFTIVGAEAIAEQLEMYENGWRPVPASRHPGRWMQRGHEGSVIVKGLRLEERPTQLGDQARAEDIAHARAQVRDQTDALRLSKKLPEGMAVSRQYRGTGADIRMTIDKGLDIPRPEVHVDEE